MHGKGTLKCIPTLDCHTSQAAGSLAESISRYLTFLCILQLQCFKPYILNPRPSNPKPAIQGGAHVLCAEFFSCPLETTDQECRESRCGQNANSLAGAVDSALSSRSLGRIWGAHCEKN